MSIDELEKSGAAAEKAGRRTRQGGARKARAPEDKQARAAVLVAAAREALETRSYHDITILDVARRAGLAKGTVYLYFPSKEALFVAVLTAELDRWFADFESAVLAAPEGDKELATAIANSIASERVLVDLVSMIHGQFKPNAGEEANAAFVEFLEDRLETAGTAVEKKANLTKGRGMRLILRAHALAVGLAHMVPRPGDEDAEPGQSRLGLYFESELSDSLADMIKASRS